MSQRYLPEIGTPSPEKILNGNMVDLRCTLKIHVGGQILRGTQVEYVKGVVATNKVDPDSFTYYDLMEVIDQTGYYEQKHNLSLFYTRPMCDMNTGLVQLTCHDDMLHMFAEYSGNKFMLIHVYVHSLYVDDSDEDEIGRDRSAIDQGCLTELGADLEVGDGQGVGDEGGHLDEVQVELLDEDTDSDCEWTPYSDESSSCASFSGVEESSDEEKEETIGLVGLANYNLGCIGDVEIDPSSDSDENNLVEGCDDDGKPDFPEFKESFMKNPQLIEGMKFPNVRVFRKLLREYHIKEGYLFKFLKNESKRVTVVCAKKCGFRLHASPMYEERSFQIKKINQQHQRTREYTNNNATSSWLSEKYLTKLSDAPETKVKSMKKIVRREWLLNVSKHKVYRAKRKALELIEGDHSQQYLRLWDYCEILRRQNPGSVAKLKVERPWVGHGPIFQRMFISYDACVKGFLAVSTVQEFEVKMKEIAHVDPTAYEWLMKEEPKYWARCMYGTRAKCNRMDNNTSEAFNEAIKEARDQPILSMVETIRRYLMTRLQTRLQMCMGWQGSICPRIITRMEKTKNLMGECEVIYSGGTIFEVISVLRSFVVDIGERTCTCRKWDVCGIPCAHGMAAIITHKGDPQEYVDKCFHSSTFAKAYNNIIKPIPDQTMWVHTEFDPISPPPLRKKSGRPKKNRRKGHDEPKNSSGGVKKHYTTLKCRLCKQPGHNARTCLRKSTQTTGEQMAGGDLQVAGNMWGGGRAIGRGAGRGRGGGSGRGRGRSANTSPTVVEGRGRGTNIGVRGRATSANIGRRGRGSSALPSIGQQRDLNKGKETRQQTIDNVGKGKQPVRMPMVRLPRPQGWNFSTRIGNAMFMTQPTRSSAASCGCGSGTGSATMPGTTTLLRQYSQGATSTPSTQKSTT
ncbi:hypothetical protein Vadar_008109 [Vaccinium darrowii]|uniref:Uncharacterized protein n=1 Tax=Vaccinium darrowii TaxID=229202 RepID=A0ACB7XP76_9ERIC|nr:hypothetical protein Vadar_008109 [Vaccinium darrowii]